MATNLLQPVGLVYIDQDQPTFDAFSRLRVSSPAYVFDAQLTYDLQPLLFEPITNGSGATVTHDATNRCATCAFSSTPTGGKAYLQTFEHFRYQPGRSQAAFITFNFNGGVANVLKFAGYSDGTNGIELQLNGTSPQVVLYSGTTAGNQTFAQSTWIDRLDGSGPSGIIVDWTKTQILVIDMQALYVGRVRLGLDIDGVIRPFLSIKNANSLAYPYIQSANLPIRVGMTCTGTVSTTMQYVCSSVVSEGGQSDVLGYDFSFGADVTAGNKAFAHLMSVRPRTTFNSIANRSRIVLDSIDAMVTSGANPVLLQVGYGQAITGTTSFNNVNATYSAMEYNTAGTISGSPTIVQQSMTLAATSSGRFSTARLIGSRYPITLDASGVARSLGTLSIIGYGYTGTSPVRLNLNWREIR